MDNRIVIEECSAGRTFCAKCEAQLSLGEVRIGALMKRGGCKYYHFRCFRKLGERPMTFSENVVFRNIGGDKKTKVMQWIADAIGKLTLRGKRLSELMGQTLVWPHPAPLRRPLTEVFQFLSIKDIELSVSLTSQCWLRVVRSEELWKRKYTSDFKLQSTQSGIHYRWYYIARMLTTCHLCQQPALMENIESVELGRVQPLCRLCSGRFEGNFVPVEAYCREVFADVNVGQVENLREYRRNREKCADVSELQEALIGHASRRYKALLDAVKRDYAMFGKVQSYIKDFRYADYYRKKKQIASKEVKLLMGFLGRRGNAGQVDMETMELVRKLKKTIGKKY